MYRLWLLAFIVCVNSTNLYVPDIDVDEYFSYEGIVPEIVPEPPFEYALVEFTNRDVSGIVSVEWVSYDPEKLYTIALVDPDVPSPDGKSVRQWLHWLVGNVHGADIATGETIAEHIVTAPGEDSSRQRHIFLVYEQPSKLTFTETRQSYNSTDNRLSFSISAFVKKYNLSSLVAGNYYLTTKKRD